MIPHVRPGLLRETPVHRTPLQGEDVIARKDFKQKYPQKARISGFRAETYACDPFFQGPYRTFSEGCRHPIIENNHDRAIRGRFRKWNAREHLP